MPSKKSGKNGSDAKQLSDAELLTKIAEYEAEVEARMQGRVKDVYKKLLAEAKQIGFDTLTELELKGGTITTKKKAIEAVENRQRRGKGSAKKSNAKFHHPDDKSLTWSGSQKGRKPNWLVKYLDEGGSEEDLVEIK